MPNIVALILILMLVNGTRGIFAVHRIPEPADVDPADRVRRIQHSEGPVLVRADIRPDGMVAFDPKPAIGLEGAGTAANVPLEILTIVSLTNRASGKMDWSAMLRDNEQGYEHSLVKFNHIGIPTTAKFEGEIDLPDLQMTVSDHKNNPFGIQWQRYWDNAPYPDLVKTVPHVAFEVDDLNAAINGQKVLILPNSPSEGLLVAFIEVDGAPVELMQYTNRGET